jgi:tetratricopeptide (TPR) repeat protein
LLWERIYQRDRRVIIHQLGAYETNLSIMYEFFPRAPDGEPDLTADPQVSDPGDRRWILNEVGLCLMNLGRLRDAVPFYERKNAIAFEMDDWHNASIGYRNLADLHIALGEVDASAEAAREALRLARQAENQQDEVNSMGWIARSEFLMGNLEEALEVYKQAEELQTEIQPSLQYHYSTDGIRHAETLIRCAANPLPRSPAKTPKRLSAETLSYARRITEANLEICERNRWEFLISMCHRVLGDLDAYSLSRSQPPSPGAAQEARAHYDEALRIARSISFRPALIEALLGRGRYVARDLGDLGDLRGLDQAFSDLREALDLATRGGYRRYEADIRVTLAWAHLAATPLPGPSPAGGGRERAREEAARARAMSEAVGYHWGQVDAEEVLDALDT